MTDFPEAPVCERLARLGKALSAPVRMRLRLLDQGERTVEELAQRGGLPLKNTSSHLQQLRAVRLLRESGRSARSLRGGCVDWKRPHAPGGDPPGPPSGALPR